jgi:glycosyltransferase involved in cell wall biosynthesis
MTISALIVAKNEEVFVEGCLDMIIPYVNEVIFVDNSSEDRTKQIVEDYPSDKIRIFSYPETQNMGELRQFSLDQATSDWIWQIDCDEFYPPEACETIVNLVLHAKDEISFRVSYHNLSWRSGFKQANFEHYPDRLYRRDVIDKYDGILPNDMTKVKPEFYKHRPFLEYDNADDKSFEHPRQPILDVTYYHLARTRGHHQEYNKWKRYNKNLHPNATEEEIEKSTIYNCWVNGAYEMEPIEVPDYVPTQTMPNPKVSVIISCYNKGKWIGETIESIMSQTHKPFEVIVVNDGSTDNSLEVIKEHPVTIIDQENQGVSRARNNGLMKATGDYFILIDGDDKLHETYIERCLAEMKGDVQVVYTDFQGIGEWDWVHSYPHPFNKEHLKTAQVFPSVMGLIDMRMRSPYGNFQDFLSEDAHWWAELVFRRNANVVHIPEPLCFYRRTIGTRVDLINERRDEANKQLNEEFKEFGFDYK